MFASTRRHRVGLPRDLAGGQRGDDRADPAAGLTTPRSAPRRRRAVAPSSTGTGGGSSPLTERRRRARSSTPGRTAVAAQAPLPRGARLPAGRHRDPSVIAPATPTESLQPPGPPLCRGNPDVAAQSGDVTGNGYTITSSGTNDFLGRRDEPVVAACGWGCGRASRPPRRTSRATASPTRRCTPSARTRPRTPTISSTSAARAATRCRAATGSNCSPRRLGLHLRVGHARRHQPHEGHRRNDDAASHAGGQLGARRCQPPDLKLPRRKRPARGRRSVADDPTGTSDGNNTPGGTGATSPNYDLLNASFATPDAKTLRVTIAVATSKGRRTAPPTPTSATSGSQPSGT